MTATLLSNNRATRDAFVPPPTLNDDGTPVKWRMFYNDNQYIADANNLADLVEVLIENYGLLAEIEDRQELRRSYLKGIQHSTRALVLSSLSADDFASLSTEERYALTNEEPIGPDFSMDDEGTPFIWSRPEPLILITEEYAPHTELTPPLSEEGAQQDVSNIVWLNSESEMAFLTSLNRLGVITFGQPRAVNRTPKDIRP